MEKLNSLEHINKLYDYANDQSEYIIPKEMYLNALFFHTACAMGIPNIRIHRETNNGIKIIVPNYFGITFGPSGMGKDHANKLASKPFDLGYKFLIQETDNFFLQQKEMTEEGKFDRRFIKPSSYMVPVSSSIEGVQKMAQTLSMLGMGSVNIVEGEIADTITGMQSMFTKMKETWDDGIAKGQVNVSDGGENYFTVEDVCFNSLLFGSPAPFQADPKKMEKLIEYYVSGGTRRSWIFHTEKYIKSEARNENFEQMSIAKLTKTEEYISKLRNHLQKTKVIVYPNEIFKKLKAYDADQDLVRERSHGIIAPDLGSTKKMEKLMGIVAILDLKSEITEDHLDFVIEYTKIMDATAASTVEIKPIYELIYNEIEKRKFCSRTDIIREIKGVTQKSLESEIILVEEHANLLGNSLVVNSNSGIIKYRIERLSQTNLDDIIISVNSNMNKTVPEGFVKAKCKWKAIHKAINADYRYSAGTFINDYITDDNYKQTQNLFIIDIDEKMTIEEAKALFHNWTYFMSTTKSHQKEKNGLVCDRFRIVLPTISKFHLEPEVYSRMYMNVLDTLGIEEADTQCRNSSRWYYGNPDGEYWYNEGELLDIRTYIPDTVEQIASDQAVSNYENSAGAPEDVRIDQALKWYLGNTSKGSRNKNTYNLALLLAEHIGVGDWEHWTNHANACLAEPQSDRSMATIFRSVKKKGF